MPEFTPRIHTDGLGSPLTKITYDFDVHGGAVGDVELELTLPDNAIVYGGFVDVITAPTSGGAATVALKIEGAGDLIAATAIASFTGQLNIVPAYTGTTSVKTTAERILTVTVATADLTAGKFNIFLAIAESE